MTGMEVKIMADGVWAKDLNAAEAIEDDHLMVIDQGTEELKKVAVGELGKYFGANAANEIKALIPTQASPENQLADKNFVNSSIQNMAARYVTANEYGNTQFNSLAALNTGPWFYRGIEYQPTVHDYAIFINTDNSVWRAGFDGVQWNAQYRINDTPFTAAQLAALNSGINNSLVQKLIGFPDEVMQAFATPHSTWTNVASLQMTSSTATSPNGSWNVLSSPEYTVTENGFLRFVIEGNLTSGAMFYVPVWMYVNGVELFVRILWPNSSLYLDNGMKSIPLPVKAGDKVKVSFVKIYGNGISNYNNFYIRAQFAKAEYTAIPDRLPGLDYSLNEQDTGKRWIDGKHIFQKTASFSGKGNTSYNFQTIFGFAGNIIERIFGCQFVETANSGSNPIASSGWERCQFDSSKTNLQVIMAAAWDGLSGYLTIQYTKV
jgi:hypothetical protein